MDENQIIKIWNNACDPRVVTVEYVCIYVHIYYTYMYKHTVICMYTMKMRDRLRPPHRVGPRHLGTTVAPRWTPASMTVAADLRANRWLRRMSTNEPQSLRDGNKISPMLTHFKSTLADNNLLVFATLSQTFCAGQPSAWPAAAGGSGGRQWCQWEGGGEGTPSGRWEADWQPAVRFDMQASEQKIVTICNL